MTRIFATGMTIHLRLFFMALVTSIAAAAITAWSVLENRNQLESRAREDLRESAGSIAYHYESKLVMLQNILALIPDDKILAARSGYCLEMLSTLVHTQPDVLNAGIMEADGRVLCSAEQAATNARFGDSAAMLPAAGNNGVTITLVSGDIVGRPALMLVRRVGIHEQQSHRRVFVLVSMDMDTRFFKRTPLEVGESAALVNSRGHVLVSYPARSVTAGAFRLPDSVRNVIITAAGNPAAVAGEFSYADYIYSYSNLRDAPAIVVTRISRSRLFDPARALLWRNSILAGLVWLVTLGLGWRLFVAPVLRKTRRLRYVTESIGRGELNARTNMPKNKDELSNVGFAVDNMANALQQRIVEADESVRQISHLNRTYRVQALVSRALLHAGDGQTLFKDICAIGVEEGGARLIWIGEVDADKQRVRCVAHAGKESDYLQGFSLSLEESSPESKGLVGTALRTRQSSYTGSFLQDPRLAPWYPLARKLGVGASAVFPITGREGISHVLVTHAAEAETFSEQDMLLLEQLAADIAYGIRALDAEKKVDFLSTHDSVTGMLNRNGILAGLRIAINRRYGTESVIALVKIEVVNFRQLTVGITHSTVEELVRQIAKCLRFAAREGDLVGRTLESRFVVSYLNLSAVEDVHELVEQLIGYMPVEIKIADDLFALRYRLGVALYPDDADSPESLFDLAMSALHTSSEESVVYFSPEINAAVGERRNLEKALRHALEKEELELYYQPVVNAVSRRICGFEALARWPEGPGGKPVSPGKFIPVAESAGLIGELGEWVLRTAAAQTAKWVAEGYTDLRVAINVSASQFQHSDFSASITETLKRHGEVSLGRNLAVEITESLLIDNRDTMREALMRLSEAGITLYLDDFGTGYSSLAYLHTLPFNVLKIDQTFTQRLGTDPRSLAMVQTILAFAKTLGIETIAEGVETEDQLKIVRELGCNLVQGYLTGRPLPVEEAHKLLQFANN